MDKTRIMKYILSLFCIFSMIHPVYAADVQENEYFSYRTESENQRQKQVKLTNQDEFMNENEELKLYLNRESLGLKVENKKTGYIWDSVLEQADSSLNKTWLGMAQSGVSIEYMDEKMKTRTSSFTNSRVQSQIQKDKNGFTVKLNWKQIGFEMEMTITLDGQQLIIQVPQKSIRETSKDNKVQSLYLYPFLGFTKNQDTDGYMFVPEGCGALIRLNEKNVAATTGYQGRIYGEDYAVSGTVDSVEALSTLSQIYMPVYGMVHGASRDAFMADIEKGEEYAMIQATPAGITTQYNWLTAKFVLRDSYFQYINKQKKGFVTVADEMNQFDIQVRYDFLSKTNASYVGMAKTYQKRLVDQGILEVMQQKELGMQLEVLMSEKKKGLFFDQTVKMTTAQQLETILQDIEQSKIPVSHVNMRGYGKSGAERQVGAHTNFEGSVLSNKSLKQLQDAFPKIDFSLYTDYMRKYKGWFGYGNSSKNALSLNEQLLQFRNHSDIYVAPHIVVEDLQDESKDLKVDNVSIANIGKLLYSNFNKDHLLNRQEVKDLYTKMFKEARQDIALYGSNAYLWEYVDAFYDIDMSSSHYFLFSEDVPFMQMVLKGYKEYYASPLNMTSTSSELLKMVEYGAIPSYLLTYEDSKKLMKTESNWIYSSQYSSLKERMEKQYKFLEAGLKAQMNATILDRKVLAPQVVEMTYSQGCKIIINYASTSYLYQGKSIPAESYKVINNE